MTRTVKPKLADLFKVGDRVRVVPPNAELGSVGNDTYPGKVSQVNHVAKVATYMVEFDELVWVGPVPFTSWTYPENNLERETEADRQVRAAERQRRIDDADMQRQLRLARERTDGLKTERFT